jgi:predicted ArsR family transcriptional regulator
MSNSISPRQREILDLLLKNRAGLSIDEIANTLNISRNAIQQHLSSLDKDKYIQTGDLKKTAGRPVRTFILAEKGLNFFPKQYAWFSELILEDMKKEQGTEALKSYLQKLGDTLARSLLPRFDGKTDNEKVDELAGIMEDLGFLVSASKDSTTGHQYLNACNCIYHDLAQKHSEVCELDKTLISTLLNKDIELVSCMAKGGHICSFKVLTD